MVYFSCLLIITYLYCILRRERHQDDHQVSRHGWGNFGILSGASVTRTEVQVEAVADMVVYGSQGKKLVNDDCVICLASFEDGEECKVLRDCGHVYHKECIDEWIWRDGHCPLCRVYARVVRSVGHDLEFGILPFP
ncbi:hypothetical protein MLD38_031469 [Melastoma candidum]|nr:hypothetical protein MLD38_031469 [Melastoma candidum]